MYRDKVGRQPGNLPLDIDAPPVVTKADANSDFILILALQSRTKSLMELSDYADNILVQQLQTIDGVSSVNVFGDKGVAMRIWLNPDKMSAYHVAFNDISVAMNAENVEIPPGKIYGNNTDLTIQTQGRLTSEADFRNVIIREDSLGIVRLGDLARIELGPATPEQNWKYNGVNAVGLRHHSPARCQQYCNCNEFNKNWRSLSNPTRLTWSLMY
jgi:HAE1 family hydrophobic/amphiphilic exporter-1/multidrug efflux pump